MARMTLEQINEKLTAAVAAGQIWNVEITDIKFVLGNLIWRDETLQAAKRAAEEVFRPMRDQLKVYEAASYVSISGSHELLNAVNALNRATIRAGNAQDPAIVAFFEAAKDYIRAAELIRDLKDKVVKGRKPSESPNLRVRTIDNTGTCGCCNRNVKLTAAGRIWDHGFQVVNRGYGRGMGYKAGGECFGTGYEPIEVSKKVWEDLLVRMEARLAALPERIATATTWLEANHRPTGPIMPNTPEAALAKKRGETAGGLRMMQSELSSLTDEIPALREAIASWTPKPLPGTRR